MIPPRFAFRAVGAEVMRAFCALCDEIEQGVHAGRDVTALLAQWNSRATRPYEPREFTSYAGAVETAEFVEEALPPRPRFDADLSWSEAELLTAAAQRSDRLLPGAAPVPLPFAVPPRARTLVTPAPP